MFTLDSIPTGDLSERQVTSLRAALPRFGTLTGITDWAQACEAVRFAHNLDEATNVNQMVVDAVFAFMREASNSDAARQAERDASDVTENQLDYLGILISTLADANVEVEDLWVAAESVETRAQFRKVLGKARLRARRFGVEITREASADDVANSDEDETLAALQASEV